jgi:phosphonoacetaldehyde hydrolase
MQSTTNHQQPLGPVKAVVLDWAGTAVDYGCMGPAAVFVDVFQRFGIRVTVAEARKFMGLEKKAHVRGLCGLPTVVAQWHEKYGHAPSEADVEALYRETVPMMVSAIARHADPIPGLIDTVAALRGRGVKIGSTTGYTRPMLEKLMPAAKQRGYAPDAVVCSSDVPAGRPYPWMAFLNAVRLEVYPLEAVVKIGDTLSDVEEGLNAGMWAIGLSQSGNELGLSEEEVGRLDPALLGQRLAEIERRFRSSGAHYVARGIWECLPLIDAIESRLGRGEQPLDPEQSEAA